MSGTIPPPPVPNFGDTGCGKLEGDGGGVEKTRALGARGDTLVPCDGIVWLIVVGEIMRARLVSKAVFMGWYWMSEDLFDERSMKSVLGLKGDDRLLLVSKFIFKRHAKH
ncbi:hypothetical protein Tco_0500157 [Tanacetum coccineum]